MNKEEHINKLIEEIIGSADNVERAKPKPFLHTRINARLNRSNVTIWEKLSWFIGRPSIAVSGLALLFLINGLAIMLNRTEPITASTEQFVQDNSDEFAYSDATTIYEIENTEP
jgi:hypothetical protein